MLVNTAMRPIVVVAGGLLLVRLAGLGAEGRILAYAALIAYVCIRGITLDDHRPVAGWGSAVLWAYIAMGMMFVVRPVSIVAYGRLEEPFHGLYQIGPSYPRATFTALLAVLGFHLVVHLPRRRAVAPSEIDLRQLGRVLRTEKVTALLLAGAGLGGYTLYLATSGQPLSTLLTGTFTGSNSVGSSAYLYLAPYLLIPAALLWLKASLRRRSRGYLLAAVAVVLFTARGYLITGQRMHLVLVVFAFLAYGSIQRRGTARAWRRRLGGGLGRKVALGAGALLVLFVIVSVRDVGADVSVREGFDQSFADLGGRVEELLTDADTEMLDALATEHSVVPSEIGFQPGRVIRTTIASAVPSAFWPGKPVPADGLLNEHLLGRVGVDARDASVAYSLAGSLFLDSGYPGVVAGFAVVGLFLRWTRRLLDAYPLDACALAAYVSVVALVPALLRGNPEDTLGRAVFTVVPLLLLLRWERRVALRPVRMAPVPAPVGV